MKQTILGAGGAIGVPLAHSLREFTNDIRLVSRHPKKQHSSDECLSADFTKEQDIYRAIEGSKVVYITAGFEYKLKVWQHQWPFFMKHVIEACLRNQSKLVFFDNIYALDIHEIPHITESSLIQAPSKKGKVRAEIDRMILDAVEKRGLQAIIARSPDFFGPIKQTSLLMSLIYDNYAKGKSAQWFCRTDAVHTTGYAPELAAATAVLGNSSDTWQQVWNLPVSDRRLTAKDWAKLFAEEMKVKPNIMALPAWGVSLLGLFVPIIAEMKEMLYQYDRDYFFDSSKYNRRFSYTPLSPEAAVHETIKALSALR